MLFASAGPGPLRACTCFVLDTPEGPVFGANLDLFVPGDGLVFINQRGMAKQGFQPGTTGRLATWVSRYGSVTFNLAGREFAFGGMNEAGLVVGSMELLASEFPEPDERPGLTIGLWAQYVLDTCSSLDEVRQVNRKVRIEDSAPPIHFLISDAQGKCVTVEWFDGKFVCRTGTNAPIKAMANMPYERALAAYHRGGPRWWWSNPGQSAQRVAAAHDLCKGFDPATHTNSIHYAFDILTKAVAAPHTKWSIVYNLPRREVWYGTVQSRSAKHLSLRDFDLDCDQPLLMLDVNAPLADEVKEHFKPYDYAVNLSMLRTLCARYELDVPEDVAVNIVKGFEKFHCAEKKD